MRTRIKFCGMTNVEDAMFAARLGVDAIGMIFVPQSPRCISEREAKKIITTLPAWVTTVGVFANAKVNEISQVLAEIPLDLLQFHGDESAEFCQQFQRPYIKAIRMREDSNLQAYSDVYRQAKALLLDTYDNNMLGGTGKSFNWNLIPSNIAQQIILAGGLTAKSVATAIKQIKPYGVDVSGGIEVAPGKKDHAKMTAFIDEVNYVDRQNR
jgi:phosphoribosylanthranilate isomerase